MAACMGLEALRLLGHQNLSGRAAPGLCQALLLAAPATVEPVPCAVRKLHSRRRAVRMLHSQHHKALQGRFCRRVCGCMLPRQLPGTPQMCNDGKWSLRAHLVRLPYSLPSANSMTMQQTSDRLMHGVGCSPQRPFPSRCRSMSCGCRQCRVRTAPLGTARPSPQWAHAALSTLYCQREQ